MRQSCSARSGRARADGRLRAEHFVHLRCELPSPDVVEHFDQFAHFPEVRLASVMDHTPGQRQFQSIAAYASFYKKDQSDEEFAAFIAARQAEQAKYADANRREIFRRGGELGVAFASHDDATLDHVAEALARRGPDRGVSDDARWRPRPRTRPGLRC